MKNLLSGTKPVETKPPFVSVIVPVHDSLVYLPRSLAAIKKTEYPDFELIVVDDRSEDGTLECAKIYADLVLQMEKRGGPGKARNRGAAESRGSILCFFDADVEIKPQTVGLIVCFFEKNPSAGALFGSYDDTPEGQNFFSQYKNLFHHFIHQRSSEKAATFFGACGAVRREVFNRMGGFPETYSFPAIEDVELGYLMTGKGITVCLAKDIQVKHLKKWTFWNLFRSDIKARAIPWTKLSQKKKLPKDLNFKLSDRISGILTLFLALSLLGLLWAAWFLIPALGSAFLLIVLNRKLYRFFYRKRGTCFAVFSVLYHWFYLFYSSVVFGVMTIYLKLGKRFFSGPVRPSADYSP